MDEKELKPISNDDINALKDKFDIIGLENACKNLEQIDFPVEHTFADGVYIRTMKGIKGTFAIGKRHRQQKQA
jgi:hypothetical protein